MEHIFPEFSNGRIMKKEMLEALREYSYTALEIKYQDYTEGILCGCQLRTDEEHILISPGMIKCRGRLFLLGKEERVAYQATEEYVSLKFSVVRQEERSDYTLYETAFILDEELTRKPDEIELARFKLKQGSKLRYEYKDFYDIQTEFDTLNLVDATWAGRGEAMMAAPVMRCFATEILQRNGIGDLDRAFAWFCLNERTDFMQIRDYLNGRLQVPVQSIKDGHEAYYLLGRVLKEIKSGKSSLGNTLQHKKRLLIVD